MSNAPGINPAIASLSLFRDIPFRVQLRPELEAQLKAFGNRPQSTVSAEEAPRYLQEALDLGERSLAFLDAEVARLTESRFSQLDPNSLRQRLLGDPRRQVDTLLNGLRNKLSNEKGEWARRVQKQLSDVNADLEVQLDSMAMSQAVIAEAHVMKVEETWLREYLHWKTDVSTRWVNHLASLLQSKTRALIEPDLTAVFQLLGERTDVDVSTPAPMRLPAITDPGKLYQERFDVPSVSEAFFETFKGSLSTVAMLAGMVVIPVIGSLMHTASTELRALIMGGTVAPITVVAFFQGKKQRGRLMGQNEEKAREKLRKSLATDARSDLDRFKSDAERYTSAYCTTVQQDVVTTLERFTAQVFERRERSVSSDLARAQIDADRINDQLNTLRQLRSSLTGQLLVDVRRRLLELPPTS